MVLFCVYYLFLQYIVSIKAWLTFLSVIFVDNLGINTVEHNLVNSTKIVKYTKQHAFVLLVFWSFVGRCFKSISF